MIVLVLIAGMWATVQIGAWIVALVLRHFQKRGVIRVIYEDVEEPTSHVHVVEDPRPYDWEIKE